MQTKTLSLLQCEVVLVHVKASCRSISMPHALFSKNPFSLKLHLCVDKVVALFWANGFKILRIFWKKKIPGTPKPGRYWPPVKGFLKKLSLLGYDLSFWRCNITAPQLNCQILGDFSMNRMVMNGWLGITIRIVKNRDPGTMTLPGSRIFWNILNVPRHRAVVCYIRSGGGGLKSGDKSG